MDAFCTDVTPPPKPPLTPIIPVKAGYGTSVKGAKVQENGSFSAHSIEEDTAVPVKGKEGPVLLRVLHRSLHPFCPSLAEHCPAGPPPPFEAPPSTGSPENFQFLGCSTGVARPCRATPCLLRRAHAQHRLFLLPLAPPPLFLFHHSGALTSSDDQSWAPEQSPAIFLSKLDEKEKRRL